MKDQPIILAIIIGDITNVYLHGPALEQWKNGMKSVIISTMESIYLKYLKYEKNSSIVDRHSIEKVIKELELQQTGLVKEETQVKAGKMLGATHLFIVDFSRFTLSTKEANDVETHRLIEMESGKTLASISLKTPVKLEFELTPIKQDLINYDAELKKLWPLEIEAVESFSNATGANFKDDSSLKMTLASKVIPIYSDFLQSLVRIIPQTKELRDIHQIYVDGANLQLEAFQMIIKAIDTGNPSLLGTANNNLDLGRAKISQWRERVGAISMK